MKIAISGKMKSGKTTLRFSLAPHLYDPRYFTSVAHLSFADPIRNALRELGITKEKHPDLYRKGAQYIGTDLCRTYDPDWWVKRMEHTVSTQVNQPHIIIDDMRFQNEYDWCRANGFLLVRLDISEQMCYNRGGEQGTLDHPSETGLDHIVDWDVWCSENTTVDERVQAVLQKAASFQNGPSSPTDWPSISKPMLRLT